MALTLKSRCHRPPLRSAHQGSGSTHSNGRAHRRGAPRRGREPGCPQGSGPALGPHRAAADARQGATVGLAAMWVVVGPALLAAERGDAMARSLQEFLDGRIGHDHRDTGSRPCGRLGRRPHGCGYHPRVRHGRCHGRRGGAGRAVGRGSQSTGRGFAGYIPGTRHARREPGRADRTSVLLNGLPVFRRLRPGGGGLARGDGAEGCRAHRRGSAAGAGGVAGQQHLIPVDHCAVAGTAAPRASLWAALLQPRSGVPAR